MCHTASLPLLKLRLGDVAIDTVGWNESIHINGVKISLHPAGHIIGSSQVRIEYNNEVWVVSGDYKTEDDGISGGFEPVKCNVFITESTFGLPIYKWQPQEKIISEIENWFYKNKADGKASVLMGYSLGKMQRILKNLNIAGEMIFAHGAVYSVNEALRHAGFELPPLTLVTRETDKKLFQGALILAPPSADGSAWMKKFQPYSTGYCSGWMLVRGTKNRRAIDQGFVLSDHADWNELNATIKNTGAEKVFVTHGYTSVFSKWLNENNIASAEVKTMYGTEEEEETDSNKIENENIT